MMERYVLLETISFLIALKALKQNARLKQKKDEELMNLKNKKLKNLQEK